MIEGGRCRIYPAWDANRSEVRGTSQLALVILLTLRKCASYGYSLCLQQYTNRYTNPPRTVVNNEKHPTQEFARFAGNSEQPGTAANMEHATENHGVPGSNPGLATSIL